jgi:hypothetical protein
MGTSKTIDQKFDTDNAVLEFEFIDENGDHGMSQGDILSPFDTSGARFERDEQPAGNNKMAKGILNYK